MISAQQALQRLQEGNRRFVSGAGRDGILYDNDRRDQLVAGQEPFAIILGCSDSRVPAEIVFDQGLGDLFVIRVAGNIVAPSQIGSVEFAVEQFKSPLVVVMGHTHCGAICATIDELQRPHGERSKNIQSIVDRIRPSIESLVSTPMWEDQGELIRHATRANVRASVNQLRHGSAMLEKLTEQEELVITGAEYDIQSGEIDFFES
ncbi:carbonic anhydrase [Solemya elarraichensis gill symbiont]|uniref:carbonic anhydrase n=1 Tax=Solemya elarraichensis gill symbiont TaxID=1918949 RepID=A0A1T2L3U4_9GAMM|nr:carbonic anhydrase [Solemya elarraichensis gill symbiont]OOZ39744.1 carbonic anhydrase [Solemya elarraichensis gill symbiont]